MKENIYILSEACATKETGAYYPQITKMKPGYDFNAINSIHRFGTEYYNSIPEVEINFDYFVMNSKSKLTDFISCSTLSSWGFIVSTKTKTLLEDFSLPIHKFFPVRIYYKKEFLTSYYYFHIFSHIHEDIDYLASSFNIGDYNDNVITTIKFSDREELLKKKREIQDEDIMRRVFAEKLQLMHEPTCDIFCIKGEFDSDIYIKDRLKNAFGENRITGFEAELTKKINW